ncbi:MAG: hypothetical protein FGM52_00125 [Mycobacterium sp.]|nr:hypothetical protein [Mycobacterium sp.]
MDSPRPRHTVTGSPSGRGPAHADRPRGRPSRLLTATVLAAAALAAVGLGTAACLGSREPARSTPTSAGHLSVPSGSVPLSTDTAARTP